MPFVYWTSENENIPAGKEKCTCPGILDVTFFKLWKYDELFFLWGETGEREGEKGYYLQWSRYSNQEKLLCFQSF